MTTSRFVLTGLVSLLCTPPLSAASSVENFSLSGIASLSSVASGTGSLFDGNVRLTSVEFGAGSMNFNGSRIDMRGSEPLIKSLVYSGSARVPAPGKAATSSAVGKGDIRFPHQKREVLSIGELTLSGLPATKSLAEGNLTALEAGMVIDVNAASLSSPEACVAEALMAMPPEPEYTGFVEQMQIAGTVTVTNVDAASGIIEFDGLGAIQVQPEQLPAAQGAAAGLSLLGLAALGSTLLSRIRGR